LHPVGIGVKIVDNKTIDQHKRNPVRPVSRPKSYIEAIHRQRWRAALFLPSLEGGGAERIFLKVAQGLLEYGLDVDIVLAKRVGQYLGSVPSGARVVDLSSSRPLRAVPALVRYLRSQRPFALLSTITNANVAALIAWRLADVPTRMIVREASTLSAELRITSALDRLVLRKVVRWLYPQADVIVAPSNGVADDLAVVAGLRREAIQVVYNPVVSNALLARAQEAPDHPWLSDKTIPVVLGIGRLSRQKDFGTLIRAFALVRRHLSARLLILGEGQERAELEDLIHREGLSEVVSLPGFVTNPYALLTHAALFVLSSQWEGLPGVLIEALACGTLVVSTDCPSGPKEILADGKYGRLVPVGNVEAMAQAIFSALSGEYVKVDPAEHISLFDVQTNTNAYLGLLLEAAG
jgi:glycosyltransferase involved in cell wall biosynthesis